jgi:hypothetical protein
MCCDTPDNGDLPDRQARRRGHKSEYRTKRLILDVHDAMADAIRTGVPYQTILDPPPADCSLCHSESTRPLWAGAGVR